MKNKILTVSFLVAAITIATAQKKYGVQQTASITVQEYTKNETSKVESPDQLFLFSRPLPVKNSKSFNVSEVQNRRIMLLNAYNFDFGNTSPTSNYVGHLNIFSPSLAKRWGFNTGIMKISYNQKDSDNVYRSFRENVFINPFDELKDSIRYLRQINSYKSETQNTVWSFYIQGMKELTNTSAKNHIYLHFHMELLASKLTSTLSVKNILTDTTLFTMPAPMDFVIRSNINSEIKSSRNILSGYFGVGATFDLQPWEGGSFFFQPTVGFTTNKPSVNSIDLGSTIMLPRGIGQPKQSTVFGKTWNPFYLIRASYTHVVNKDSSNSSTLVFGMDIRGLFPYYAPQYAAYVGLNVGVDSILELVKGK